MQLEDMLKLKKVVATDEVEDNLHRTFPAGTVFCVYEVDLDSDLPGPCLYPEGETDIDATWFYWFGEVKWQDVPACQGKLAPLEEA